MTVEHWLSKSIQLVSWPHSSSDGVRIFVMITVDGYSLWKRDEIIGLAPTMREINDAYDGLLTEARAFMMQLEHMP